MLDFLYKNSFFRYTAAINYSGGKRIPIIAPFVAFYFIMMVSIASGIVSFSIAGAAASALASVLFLAGAIVGANRNCTPNLAGIIPISGKRKCLYDFFVVLVITLCSVLAVALFIGVIALVVWAVMSASGGAESDVAEETVFGFRAGVYGGIFCAAYVIILYSAGMAGGYFKSRKRRNLFYALFTVAVLLGIIFTGIPYFNNAPANSEIPPFGSPFADECYAYMKLPWLCVLFWCLIAAGMFAWAVYMGLKYHKPKKY